MKIAFLDSGVGGLTVLKEAIKWLPKEDFLYYADSDNAPYGEKSREEISRLILNAVEFIASQEIKALVVACNTATSVVIDQLREIYDFPILGMEPAVKPALLNSPDKRVVICATERTLKEEKLESLIQSLDADQKVDFVSLQKLVMLAENYEFEGDELGDYLAGQFSDIDWQECGALVLGCTHFPYFRKEIQKLIPDHVTIVDGNEGTVRHLKKRLEGKLSQQGKGTVEFYRSGEKVGKECYQRFLDRL